MEISRSITTEDLPPEILLQFFVIYSYDEPVPIPWDFQESPLALLHVCSRWRRLAIYEPNIWRNLVIAFNVENIYFEDMMDETLVRSGGLPLALHLYGETTPSWIDLFVDCMDTIWDRLTVLDIVWRNPEDIPDVVFDLCIDDGLFFPLDGCRPNLTDLVLDGVQLSLEDLSRLLYDAGSLRRLVFAPSNDTFEDPSLDMSPVHLPNLTYLSICVDFQEVIENLRSFLGSLNSGSLTHLALIHTSNSDLDQPRKWIPKLHKEVSSFKSLTNLRIDLRMYSHSLYHAIKGLKHLRVLIAPHSKHDNMFLPILTNHDLTRIVFNASNSLRPCLDSIEAMELATASEPRRGRRQFLEMTVVWDEQVETPSALGGNEPMYEADELGCWGYSLRFVAPKELDPETDLNIFI